VTAGAVPVDSIHRVTRPGRHRVLGRERRRFVRSRARGIHHRSLQDRRDPAARAVERGRGGRVRDARVGRLVQHAAPAGAARVCSPYEFEEAYCRHQSTLAELATLT